MKIFIENDFEFDQEEMDTNSLLHECDFKFDKIITEAFSNTVEAFDAIVNADEVYCSTAFLGDSARVFDALAYHLIKHNITGKKLFIFRKLNGLCLWNLSCPENFKILFTSGNDLFCEETINGKTQFSRVDITSIL